MPVRLGRSERIACRPRPAIPRKPRRTRPRRRRPLRAAGARSHLRGLTFSYTSWLEPNTDGDTRTSRPGGFSSGPLGLPGRRPDPSSKRGGRTGARCRPRSKCPMPRTYRSCGTGSSVSERSPSESATTPTDTRAASASGRTASACRAACSLRSPGGQSSSAECGRGRTIRAATRCARRAIPVEARRPEHGRRDNLIHDIGIDYRDFSGVMSTYTANVVVSHNELYNLPYSGINTGLGWGANDAGGNNDYKSRATGNLYQYQPLTRTRPSRRTTRSSRTTCTRPCSR